MNMRTVATLIITTLLLLFSSSTFCQIYKWTDADGSVHFSSSPPPQGNAETVQPKINTYTSVKLSASKQEVIIYSTTRCGVCKKAKAYFRKHQIPFKEYDVETSEKGKRDYQKLNGYGVPIILVGTQRMDGFSAARFEKMYGG